MLKKIDLTQKKHNDNLPNGLYWCQECDNLIQKSNEQEHLKQCKYKHILCPFCNMEIIQPIYGKHLQECSDQNVIQEEQQFYERKYDRINAQLGWEDMQNTSKKREQERKLEREFENQVSIKDRINQIERLQEQQSVQLKFEMQERNYSDQVFEESKFTDNNQRVVLRNGDLKKRYRELIEKEKEIMKQEQQQRELNKKREEQEYILKALQRDQEKKIERQIKRKAQYFAEIQNKDDSQMCCICLTNLKFNEGCAILSCAHRYHVHCINGWLKQKKDCPYCKQPALPL